MSRAKGSSFHFRQFVVAHDRCAMKVNTDAVVMGAYVAQCCESWSRSGTKVLDIGTGTGILALMLAQKLPATIMAVEANEEAFEQASQNFSESIWDSNLQALHSTFQAYTAANNAVSFDLIVSNPPFFEPINMSKGGNQQLPDADRALARFDDALPFRELMHGVSLLLREEGFFYVIIPSNRAQELMALGADVGLFLQSECQIIYKEHKPPGRVILCFRKSQSEIEKCALVLYDEKGQMTESFQALTKDYYL